MLYRNDGGLVPLRMLESKLTTVKIIAQPFRVLNQIVKVSAYAMCCFRIGTSKHVFQKFPMNTPIILIWDLSPWT